MFSDVYGRRPKSQILGLAFVDQFVDPGMPKTTHRLNAISVSKYLFESLLIVGEQNLSGKGG